MQNNYNPLMSYFEPYSNIFLSYLIYVQTSWQRCCYQRRFPAFPVFLCVSSITPAADQLHTPASHHPQPLQSERPASPIGGWLFQHLWSSQQWKLLIMSIQPPRPPVGSSPCPCVSALPPQHLVFSYWTGFISPMQCTINHHRHTTTCF